MRTFPVIRDLVTDVAFNYEKAREIPSFTPDPSVGLGEFRMQQVEAWSARRSSASASSATCARTPAM